MLVPGGDAPHSDDATRLVLDMVKQVLDPVGNDPSFLKTCRPKENGYINANINNFNGTLINTNYQRWSNNDCSGIQSGNVLDHTFSEKDCHTNEEIISRTATKYKYRKMNFWDQYTAGDGEYNFANMNYNHMGGNRNMSNINQQLSHPQYLNNKFAARTSWRDNAINNPNISNQILKPFNQPNGQYHHHPQQQQPKVDNNYYHGKKSMRKCCSFCRKNGESVEFYTSHSLYENGKPACPVLRQCVCNICGQSGHTMSHCSLNPSKTSIVKMIQRFNAMK